MSSRRPDQDPLRPVEQGAAVRVRIYSQEFLLRGSADPQLMREVAQFVDRAMRTLAQETKTLATERLAILTAVNIAGELFEWRRAHQKLAHQVASTTRRLVDFIESAAPDAEGNGPEPAPPTGEERD